jgi:hypothetical protein
MHRSKERTRPRPIAFTTLFIEFVSIGGRCVASMKPITPVVTDVTGDHDSKN